MKRITVLAIALLPLCASAQEEVAFDYIDFGLVRTDIVDPLTDERTEFGGFGLQGSVELRDHVHLFGDYSSESDDGEPGLDVDTQQLAAGVGTHWTFMEDRFGVYGRLGFIKASIHQTGFENLDDDGVYAALGARFMPARGFEIRAGVEHFELDFEDPEVGSETSPFVAGDIYLTDVVALTLEYTEHDDADTLLLGVRFYPQRDAFSAR